MRLTSILFGLIFCFSATSSYSQFGNILGDIAKDVVDDVVDDVSDEVKAEITRRISKEITRRIMKSVNRSLDSLFKESYKQDSLDRNDPNWTYPDFLATMNANAELPDAYHFDIKMLIEMEDYNKEKSKFEWLLSKTEPIFALRQLDKKNKSELVVIDGKSDIIAIYNEEENTVQALAGMMSLAKAMSHNPPEDLMAINLTRKGKGKKVAGYHTILYTSETEDENVDTNIAEDFPVNWKNTVGLLASDFVSANYKEQMEDVSGFMLRSESEFKSNGQKSKWDTKKVDIKKITIDNNSYTKASQN